jgi:heme exporter protein CcmD
MSHTPFIWAAYTVGTVVLLWCALAPLVRQRAALRDIRRLIQIEERHLDTDS